MVVLANSVCDFLTHLNVSVQLLVVCTMFMMAVKHVEVFVLIKASNVHQSLIRTGTHLTGCDCVNPIPKCGGPGPNCAGSCPSGYTCILDASYDKCGCWK